MRNWEIGIVGLGMLTAACSGGDLAGTSSSRSAPAQETAGTERVSVARAPSTEATMAASAPDAGVVEPSLASAERIEPEPTPDSGPASGETCPTDIGSLRVRARTLPSGAVIVLTARGEADVDLLRDHVRQLALVHSVEHSRQCSHASHVGVPLARLGSTGDSRIADPASPLLTVHDLRLVEIANGVRIELRHDDDAHPAFVRQLRARVRDDVGVIRAGICPLSFQMS